MSNERRKKKLICSAVQVRLIVRMLFHWVAFCACLGLVLYIFGPLMLPMADPAARAATVRTLVISVAVVSLCLVPAFVWDTILFSHRFVGPVVRIQSEIRRYLTVRGGVPTIKLRDTDMWKDVAADVNSLFQIVNSKQPETRADLVRDEPTFEQQSSHDAELELVGSK